jgi:hypothetical protein
MRQSSLDKARALAVEVVDGTLRLGLTWLGLSPTGVASSMLCRFRRRSRLRHKTARV